MSVDPTVEEFVVEMELRVQLHLAKQFWGPERRAMYLIRDDVEFVLSCDRRVWPGADQGSVATRIAISAVVSSTTPHLEGYWNPQKICEVDPSWRKLGYDVVDFVLLSGLSNCGYSSTWLAEHRGVWRSRINEWHLFDDVSTASEFRTLTDARVSEHAPFVVCGIYLVEGALER